MQTPKKPLKSGAQLKKEGQAMKAKGQELKRVGDAKKAAGKAQAEKLTYAELEALSHQKRGMGEQYGTYVKKSGSVMNELGKLTSNQQTQLNKYMSKASLPKKIYEALPNIGRIVGSSAADIPKGSKLEKQKTGGMVKKMKTGGMVNPNALVSVTKVSRGRPAKSAEPKSAAKKATGRVGGTSKAPKRVTPKK